MTDSLLKMTIGGQSVDVESVAGTFAMSSLFCVTARLIPSTSTKVELAALCDKEFELTISPGFEDADGSHNRLHLTGIVHCGRVDQDNGAWSYELKLYPRVFRLTETKRHRVFQKKTVQVVVDEVLGSGVADWRVADAGLQKHAYIAQFAESDWDFVERLLVDEGLSYYFVFGEGETKLVIAANSSAAPPIPGDSTVEFQLDAGSSQSTNDGTAVLIAPRTRRRVGTDEVRLRAHNPTSGQPHVSAKYAPSSSWRQYYDACGRFEDDAGGARLARITHEAMSAMREVVEAQTNCVRLIPGHKFTFTEPEGDFHGRFAGFSSQGTTTEYLVTGMTIRARRGALAEQAARHRRRGSAGLSVEVTLIPATTPYRSAVPVARLAPGPQTAIVVGRSGEELNSDEQGRVQAQFYWDREGALDHTAGTFMRVGQFPLAGSMMQPRIGWDQLVSYVAGDVDMPIVLGHLYDGVKKVPYDLPANKTRTAWQTATTPSNGTSNEIRYEDKAGAEEMFLNASFDMTQEIGKDSNVKVGVNQTTDIGVNQTVSIGANQSLQITGSQEVDIGAMEALTVSGTRTRMIGGSDTEKIGVARMVTVTGGATMDADGGRSVSAGAIMLTAAGMSVDRTVIGKSSITVGGAWISAAASGVECVTGGSSKETIGGAKLQAGAAGVAVNVKGKLSQTVGGALISAAGKNVGETSAAALEVQVGGAMVMAGPKITIEAKSKLVIKVGGTTLTMTPSKIHIKSPSIASPGATIAKTGSTVNHNP